MIELHYWPTPNGHKVTRRHRPTAGQPLSDAQRRILFVQGVNS
ncbi:hypothetical protein BH23PSE2_BH23PSE2_14340 [soil metagenome]